MAIAATAGAAPPARISHLADRSSLTDRDRAEIGEYAEAWGKQLESSSPAEVDEARDKLGDPFRAVRIGEVFRFEYSKALVPVLEKVVQEGPSHAAVNAMQVLGLLGTPASVEIILAHASIETEPDFAIRLTAANVFPVAVQQDALPPNEINKALRDLGDAAAAEASAAALQPADDQIRWLVLRRQFEAISSVAGPASREVQVKVIKAATDAMEGHKGPSDLMQATYRALMLVRNEYLRLQPADQETLGKSLAPVLYDLCTVAAEHWDAAQGDETARESYGGAVQISENLLKLIDAHVRPNQSGPRTELGPAWRNRQKVQFDTDHDKWRTLLMGPPYNKPR